MSIASSPPDFELACVIDVPMDALQAFLCDLHCYVPLHPFIESITDLPASQALPRAKRYRVVDRIPVGPFRLKTVYSAALDPVAPDEIHGWAWQRPAIRLHTIYRLAEAGAGTRLSESCHIEAPRLLRRFTVTQAKKAHAKTLDELKVLLEAGRGVGASATPLVARASAT